MEHGFPAAREARSRLTTELDVARRKGIAVLKVVHGYGSSGTGGKLRTALRRDLAALRHDGKIGRVVFGEAWSIFEAEARALMDRYPELRGDRDLEQSNAGITFVELKR